jgi:hypothetical protein
MWMYQSLNFTTTANSITNSRIIDLDSGKTVTQPVNTNGNISVSLWSGIGMKLKKINMSINLQPNFKPVKTHPHQSH